MKNLCMNVTRTNTWSSCPRLSLGLYPPPASSLSPPVIHHYDHHLALFETCVSGEPQKPDTLLQKPHRAEDSITLGQLRGVPLSEAM